jgi:hypothetical protein
VPNTILSLEESNKLRKAYTHGVFGKGGSTACAFSDATIVVTRRQPDLLEPGDEDRITVAVVREADAPDVGLPFFRYIVGADNLPYSVPASAHPEFQPGTLVLHLNYQAGRMGTETWQQEESIYTYGETILFDPTLPYQLLDSRSAPHNRRPEGRGASVLAGLSQRLDQLQVGDGTLLGASRWQTIPIPEVGDVRMRWWLFTDIDKRRRRAAKGYIVLFTTNGQVHHGWDQAKLAQMVESRRRVGQRLLVEVDCDGIDLKKRYKVFDSFRVQVRRGSEGRSLEEAVSYALEHDPDLDAFESEFVRESLKAGAQKISAAFRKRLSHAIWAKIGGVAPTATKGTGQKPPKPKAATDLYPEPTTMTGPEQITLLIGQRATAYMEINAVDGFVPDAGTILVSSLDKGLVPTYGTSDLRRGRMQLTFAAPADMAEGVRELEIALEWLRPRGGMGRITWPLRVCVVEKLPEPGPRPVSTGGTLATSENGEIALIWVKGGGDMNWGDDVVGELQEIRGSDLATQNESYGDLKNVEDLIPTIVLNDDFGDWAAYKRSVARRISDTGLESRRERYALGVGVGVANLAMREREVRKKHEAWQARQNGNQEPSRSLDSVQQQRALGEGARGVVALMPDFDALLGDLGDSDGTD